MPLFPSPTRVVAASYTAATAVAGMWLQNTQRDTLKAHGRTLLAAVLRIFAFFYPALFALFVLYLLYSMAYKYWDEHTGGLYRWNTTWPEGRTRLVILMFVLPVWGAFMAVVTLLHVGLMRSRFSRRVLNGWRDYLVQDGYQPLNRRRALELSSLAASEDSDEAADDGTDYPSHKRARRWRIPPWKAIVGAYSSLVVLGLYFLATYEQKDDIRYRYLVQDAVDRPRPQGYHTGGA